MSIPPDPSDQPPVQNGSTATSRAKKILRVLVVVVIALAAILIITLPSYPEGKDYISYWSAGKLLLKHADPYSPSGVFALQKAHGSREAVPIIMRNPPWALFLVVPLGFVNPLLGYLLWVLAAVGCVFASIRLLNVPAKDSPFAFVFAPLIACILCGQSSPFLLLGFSLFLRFHRARPFLAGASLLLMAFKPHLFLVFWAVLLVDCIYRRRLLILAGGATALAAASAFPLLLNPHIWQHYFAMLHASELGMEVFPTASMQLRILIDPRAVWLLLVPSTLATLWGLWYYIRARHTWDWRIHGMLLMIIAILCSPYGGISDETVLLPSIFSALTSPRRAKYSSAIIMAANTLALAIVFSHASLTSRAYLWTPFAWLAWFLYATRKSGQPQNSPIELAETTSMEKV
jgi:hypothetical protein